MIDPAFRFILNNGVTMPGIGFGGGQANPDDTISAVSTALRQGYRLLDTGAIYGDERLIGEAIRRSGVPRNEIFLVSKLWIHDFGQQSSVKALDLSLQKLGVDQIDLYLLHWPIPADFDRTIAAYSALESQLAAGKLTAIGVSNFTPDLLDTLISATSVVPAVNQIEVHPYFSQSDLRARHAAMGIVTQAWSPIGGIDVYMPQEPLAPRNLLDDKVLHAIAAQYGKTPAQVVLRWHLQIGDAFITKSAKPARIAENSAIFDFSLSDEDMARIDALETGVRGGPSPEQVTLEVFSNRVSD